MDKLKVNKDFSSSFDSHFGGLNDPRIEHSGFKTKHDRCGKSHVVLPTKVNIPLSIGSEIVSTSRVMPSMAFLTSIVTSSFMLVDGKYSVSHAIDSHP